MAGPETIDVGPEDQAREAGEGANAWPPAQGFSHSERRDAFHYGHPSGSLAAEVVDSELERVHRSQNWNRQAGTLVISGPQKAVGRKG